MTYCENTETIRRNYQDFLAQKIDLIVRTGFDIEDHELHPSGEVYQNIIIKHAARKGKMLIASSFGTGKTHIQSELARIIVSRFGGKALIVAPLSVRHGFINEDGPRLGIRFQYVRTDEEIEAADTPFLITNYERVRDGNIDPRKHNISMVSLDEGNSLRDLASKTFAIFSKVFANVPYRFVASATPDPNNHMELLNYAEFLDVSDRGRILTKYFKRNPKKAGDLTIIPHHENNFWLWVASWAVFVYEPQDLGDYDANYKVPELRVHYHRLEVDHTRAWEQKDSRGQHFLLLDVAKGIQGAIKEKRETIVPRLKKAREIMDVGFTDRDGIFHPSSSDIHWLLWHHLEQERKYIEKEIPEAVTVFGSQELEEREARIIDFTHGKIRILATKPEIAGSGCNFQRHCFNAIFMGIRHQFDEFIQAVYRICRNLQPMDHVNIHIIYSASEDGIMDIFRKKWSQHNKRAQRMREIIREYGLNVEVMKKDLQRQIGIDRQEYRGNRFSAINNDCVLELLEITDMLNRKDVTALRERLGHLMTVGDDNIDRLANGVFGAIVTSIPFSTHYEYVDSFNDFGHNESDDRFFDQMDFLIPLLYRVIKPGRIAAIHVKDLINYSYKSGTEVLEINPFTAMTIFAFIKHGWAYEGEIFIPTDVVRENNSTYRLTWAETRNDASKMGVGLPEKVLLFRKPPTSTESARADEPVVHSKTNYTLSRHQLDSHAVYGTDGKYSFDEHLARLQHLEDVGNLPKTYLVEPPKVYNPWLWDDVNFMFCLNSNQVDRRQEKHTCPLPIDIVRRLIRRYTSDPDLVDEPDVILEPFAGLLTTVYVAIEEGRRGYGIELNDRDWLAGIGHCERVEKVAMSPTMFNLRDFEGEPIALALQQQTNGKQEAIPEIAIR